MDNNTLPTDLQVYYSFDYTFDRAQSSAGSAFGYVGTRLTNNTQGERTLIE